MTEGCENKKSSVFGGAGAGPRRNTGKRLCLAQPQYKKIIKNPRQYEYVYPPVPMGGYTAGGIRNTARRML